MATPSSQLAVQSSACALARRGWRGLHRRSGTGRIGAAKRSAEWQAALAQAKLLIGAHAPVTLAVVAHERCAGHPVHDEAHVGDASAMARKLKAETEFAGPVAAMVARYRADLKWRVEIVNRF